MLLCLPTTMNNFEIKRLRHVAVKKVSSSTEVCLRRVLLNSRLRQDIDDYLNKDSVERPNRPTAALREMDFMPIISEE